MGFNLPRYSQRRRIFVLLALTALTAGLSGCATITRGTTEQLKVESIPANANVRLDTGQTGITPATFTVPRKRDVAITVSKDGYVSVTQTVTTKIAGRGAAGMAGNVLIGGVIGVGVDAVSGAMLNHTPNPLVINLVALKTDEPLAVPVPAPSAPAPSESPAAAPAPLAVSPEIIPTAEAAPKKT